jgi:hypothetical protein
MATRIGERVLTERDPAALVRLALALNAVSHGWTDVQAGDYSRRVLARMNERGGQAHRRFYAVSLAGMADRASASPEVRSLVSDLHDALEEEYEPDPVLGGKSRLLDPALPEDQWNRLALTVVPSEDPPEGDEPSLEALAGVEDDDGESGEEDEIADIDFNAISDALDDVRPPAAADSWPPLHVAGAILAALGIILGVSAIKYPARTT